MNINNFVNTVVDTPETVFTATTDTKIDAFTASNTSSVNASYKAYIVVDSVVQPIIPFKIVVWGENDLGLGLVNQVIPSGGSLQVESSALSSIYFTVSGRSLQATGV